MNGICALAEPIVNSLLMLVYGSPVKRSHVSSLIANGAEKELKLVNLNQMNSQVLMIDPQRGNCTR
jgi:hypothetical protein